jgi:putative DNA primase/helicase
MTVTDPADPRRPEVLQVKAEQIPARLTAVDRWVCWELRQRHGRWTKPPLDPKTGRRASVDDPSSWAAFQVALARYEKGLAEGVGLVLGGGGLVGVDLDHAVEPASRAPKPWAEELLGLAPTYTELSPSGAGLRLFGLGSIGKALKRGYRDGAVELYSEKRYLTVTGHRLTGRPGELLDITDGARRIVEAVQAAAGRHATPTAERGGGLAAPADSEDPDRLARVRAIPDEELLARARQARNGDKFRGLFDLGDLSLHGNDHSRADKSLVHLLTFWTSGDAERVDRLFRRSKLYRPKWDDHRADSTYGANEVAKAIEETKDRYDPAPEGAAPQAHHLTDLGNARRLVALHGADLCYLAAWKKWLVWDGRRWAPDDTEEVMRRAKHAAVEMYDEAASLAKELGGAADL